MKPVIRLLLSVLLASAIGGCSNEEGTTTPTSPTSTNGVYMVQIQSLNTSGLPPCNSKTGGETAMITSTLTLVSCMGGVWVPIPCTALIGGAVAYNSTTKTLWACTQNPNGGSPQWMLIPLPQGPAGQQGPQGAAGATSLVVQTPESSGTNCPNGGTKVESGVDKNDNGSLEVTEITSTSYVCKGDKGETGETGPQGDPGSQIQVTPEPPEEGNCVAGGWQIDIGIVVNGSFQIQQTVYVCNGVGTVGPVPIHAPTSLTISVDEDPTPGNIQGTVKIGRASDESDVATYNLYWGSNATTKLALTATLPKMSTDLTYPLAAVVPPAATHLLAFTANMFGEMTNGVTVEPIDNFPVYTDISAGQGYGSGYFPSAVIDTANSRLLVVTQNHANSDKPALFRCNLAGSDCTYIDISAGQGAGSGLYPSAVIDTANGKLLAVTQDNANGSKPALFRCNLDGSGCTYADISANQPVNSGDYPSALLDTTNNKLLVVTMNRANSDKPALFRCNLDGLGCTYTDISADQGFGSGWFPSPVIDTLSSKLLVLTRDQANDGKLALFRCNLDGSGCTYTDISAETGQGTGSGHDPSAVIDTANNKLLVVTSAMPALFRCNLDGSGCTYTDISAGHSEGSSGQFPSAIIDNTNGKLLVATRDWNNDKKPALFRCELDGSGCTYTDISAGQPADCGFDPSAVIDTANNKLLVVTDFSANGIKPALFSIGLW